MYDGDEMNLHLPQSIPVDVEFQELTAACQQIITPKSSECNICIVQDSVIGAYLMSLHDDLCDREEFFQIIMTTNIGLDFMNKKLERIHARDDMSPYGGRALISMLLPNTFCMKAGDIVIESGLFLRGLLTKSIINKKLIRCVHKEYGMVAAANFIDNIQFMTNKWLESYGFSIGIKDCIADAQEKIRDVINTSLSEAYLYEQNTVDPVIREIKVNHTLSQAKDTGMKLASEALREDNNFVKCIKSASKGDMFNLGQTIGLVSQQSLGGKRIQPQLSGGTRTLPHYHFELKTDSARYESRGFIQNSFLKGLNPREFFFHMMTGRSGVVDTAVGTASSGYNSRKLRALLRDVVVHYDGTVRDMRGNVIQYVYGGVGLSPSKCVVVDGVMRPFDIRRIAHKYQ